MWSALFIFKCCLWTHIKSLCLLCDVLDMWGRGYLCLFIIISCILYVNWCSHVLCHYRYDCHFTQHVLIFMNCFILQEAECAVGFWAGGQWEVKSQPRWDVRWKSLFWHEQSGNKENFSGEGGREGGREGGGGLAVNPRPFSSTLGYCRASGGVTEWGGGGKGGIYPHLMSGHPFSPVPHPMQRVETRPVGGGEARWWVGGSTTKRWWSRPERRRAWDEVDRKTKLTRWVCFNIPCT